MFLAFMYSYTREKIHILLKLHYSTITGSRAVTPARSYLLGDKLANLCYTVRIYTKYSIESEALSSRFVTKSYFFPTLALLYLRVYPTT